MGTAEHIEEAAREHAVAAAAAKAAPPVAVSGAMIAGVPMSDVVLCLTAIYLLFQIGYLAWKWSKEWRESDKRGRRK